ncbi:hypothetical protein D9M73_191820 [compost metagenome]
MWQLGHALGTLVAVPAQQGGSQCGLQRRYFQLVGHAPGGAVEPLEVVGIDRLRCTVERVDHLFEMPGGKIDQVQEGPLAQHLVWVWSIGAHQQGRAVDAATGQHVVASLDRNGAPGGCHAAGVHRQALQAGDLVAFEREPFGASQVEQLTTFF